MSPESPLQVIETAIATIKPGAEHPKLAGDTDIYADLDLDSLAMVELAVALEEIFHVSLPLTSLTYEELRTIDDWVALVEKTS